MGLIRAFSEPDHFDVLNLTQQFYSSPASPAGAARAGVRGCFGNQANAYNERGVYARALNVVDNTVLDLWIHYGLYFEEGATGRYLALNAADDSARLVFILTKNINSEPLLEARSSLVGLLASGSGLVPGTLNAVDIYIMRQNNGYYRGFEIYINGNRSTVHSSIPLSNGGTPLLANLVIGVPSTATAATASGLSRISEIIVADEDTRLMQLWTRYPVANGQEQQWLGSYTDISEAVDNHETFIQASLDGQRSSFELNTISPPEASIIVGRCAYCTAARSTNSGVNAIQFGTTDYGNNELLTPSITQDVVFKNNFYLMPTPASITDADTDLLVVSKVN